MNSNITKIIINLTDLNQTKLGNIHFQRNQLNYNQNTMFNPESNTSAAWRRVTVGTKYTFSLVRLAENYTHKNPASWSKLVSAPNSYLTTSIQIQRHKNQSALHTKKVH